MHQIRRQHTEPEAKVVVRGGTRLAEIWPGELDRPMAPVPSAQPAAEVGGADAVVALLATVEGVDPAAYRAWHGQSAPALRALAAHCRAAILQAAMRTHGDLSPEAVLAELHDSLRTPISPLLDRIAS